MPLTTKEFEQIKTILEILKLNFYRDSDKLPPDKVNGSIMISSVITLLETYVKREVFRTPEQPPLVDIHTVKAPF